MLNFGVPYPSLRAAAAACRAALYQTVQANQTRAAQPLICYPMRIAHCRKGVKLLAMSEVILTALISGGFSLSVPEAGSTNPAV